MLNQENTIEINNDQSMLELFNHLDALNGFKKLHIAWLEFNKENWHSDQLSKSLNMIFEYVNQLASYISLDHDEIDVQISISEEELKGKQFATVLKRTDEWKLLKKYMKQEQRFMSQPLTVQALCTCILQRTKEFMCKL